LFGKVLGTYPYYVELNLETGESTCTCPVGGDCKHTAAVRVAFEEGAFIDVGGDETADLIPEAAAWSRIIRDPGLALDLTLRELSYSLDSDESGSETAMLFLRALKLVEITGDREALSKLESVLDAYSEVFSDYELVPRLRDRLRELEINLKPEAGDRE
ncbi:MAG: hypothetical protein GXO14_00500, partial [Thermococci archaeon]|nr:hypothetical protein [Thermococci archaeon]